MLEPKSQTCQALKGYGRLVFTSDLLKIDDRNADLFPNPQRINIEWLRRLLEPVLRDLSDSIEVQTVFGDEGGADAIRFKIFNRLGLPLESASWAALYDGRAHTATVVDILGTTFRDNDLLIGFESPPYLLDFCQTRGISYIDFCIHPVRFLPDYMFALRTNVPIWYTKLERVRLPDDIIRDFARISAARTARVFRKPLPDGPLALFLGQIEIDASLITDGRVAGLEDVRDALRALATTHAHVFYKAHPHLKEQSAVKNMIKEIRGCDWIDVNLYDALARPEICTVGSLSSGGVIEARYFGREGRWLLKRLNFCDPEGLKPPDIYHPVYAHPFDRDFWRYLLNDEIDVNAFTPLYPRACDGAFKFTLNQKWGR